MMELVIGASLCASLSRRSRTSSSSRMVVPAAVHMEKVRLYMFVLSLRIVELPSPLNRQSHFSPPALYFVIPDPELFWQLRCFFPLFVFTVCLEGY